MDTPEQAGGWSGDGGLDLPISAEEHLEERVPVAPGGTLYLDMDRGSVRVSTHDRAEVEVRGSARGWGSHLVLFHLDRRGDDIELEVDVDRWLAALLFGTRIRVDVRVPREYSADVRTGGGSVQVEGLGGRLWVRTSGGAIRASGVSGTTDLQTSGGSIAAERIGGDLRSRTSGGSIRVLDVAGRVDARTTGGAIDLETVDGPVEARTAGGRIRVAFVDEPEGTVRTGGGAIDVEFPDDAGTDLDARSGAGRISVAHDHVVTERGRSRIVALVNGGGPPLLLRTGGGSIDVRATPRRRVARPFTAG